MPLPPTVRTARRAGAAWSGSPVSGRRTAGTEIRRRQPRPPTEGGAVVCPKPADALHGQQEPPRRAFGYSLSPACPTGPYGAGVRPTARSGTRTAPVSPGGGTGAVVVRAEAASAGAP